MSNAIPEDLKEMKIIAAALRDMQERDRATKEWAGITELHNFYAAFAPSACIALIERVAAAEAERDALKADNKALVLIADSRQATIERLSAPVTFTEAESVLGKDSLPGDVTFRVAACGFADALIAARKDAQCR
jgi:hypothetical protein